MLALRRSVERALSVLHYHASNWKLQGTSQDFTCSKMPVQLAACFQTVKARKRLATGFHLHQSCGEAVERASGEPGSALPLRFPFPTACSGCKALGCLGAGQGMAPLPAPSCRDDFQEHQVGSACTHQPACPCKHGSASRALRGVCAASHRKIQDQDIRKRKNLKAKTWT